MFVHLHTHSQFSFLDGGSEIESLVRRAVELDMPALALTDHDNLCGAVKFQTAAAKAGIRAIQGVEVTLYNGHHLVLLAKGPEGYGSLCRLLTRAHLESTRREPRVTMPNLRENAEGLIALSGCRRGEIPAAILARDYAKARQAALTYQEIWGRDFYLELQDTFIPGTRGLNASLAELAAELGLGIVATNNVHFAEREDFPVHDILTCVRTLTRVQDVHSERPLNGEEYLKSPRQMGDLFRKYPEALDNAWQIAERCRPALELDKPLFPEFPLPPGQKAEEVLRDLSYQGASNKYKKLSQAARDRLEHELYVINTLGYAGYFLVVWDIVQYARNERIRFAGRGSAADSMVAYCLGITEVDSFNRGLLFERFMSLERAQKPDIDIDFDSRHRDKVASYVYRQYGDDKVASVATYNTYRGRSAVRDIGKALGLPEDEIGRQAKKLPFYSHADQIRRLMVKLPELRVSGLDDARFELLLDLCEKIAGFPRFLGTHMGGLVVCREPLQNITPLQMAAKGMVITQFDKDDVEDLGLVKLDLLSLRTLGAVDDAVIRIHNNGKSLNYDEIPLNDAETYQMLNTGDTIGVFQLESPAQRALQARLGASHMEDIVASVAIIRPGPIKGNMVEPYIARRHGQEPVTFMHPKLEPILRKTYGVVLFQEQVIEIATAVANFTPGEADNLRRVMTHSRSMKTMEEIGRTFVERSVQNGVSQEDAERIFACMLGYASYGFCEAHAAAFGTTAFKTAYLLQHFPAEFYAAILSNQPMGYYPPHIICNEARRRGIKMLPPRVNNSAEKFKVEGNAIRVPLVQIKGLSRPGVKDMLGNQPFTSFADLVIRTDLNRDEIETLIKCGATDEMDANRRRLLAQVPGCLESRRASREGKAELFVAEPAGAFEIPDLTEEEKHYWEFELLGLDVREHVMTRFRKSLMAQRCRTSRELRSVKDQSWVRTAGLLLSPHRPPTKSGKIVVFMSLEDEFGLTDVTVFEDVYQQYGHLIFAPQTGPLLVEGILQKRGNGISIVARKIEQVIQVI